MSGRQHRAKRRGNLISVRITDGPAAATPRPPPSPSRPPPEPAIKVVRGRVVSMRRHLAGSQTIGLEDGTVLHLPKALALYVKPPADYVSARVIAATGRVIEARAGGWWWKDQEATRT